ncbi:ABC transporter ATP-binding protein [Bacillus salacetis]|uniref:ABC transporter ATP-binding protein n=1 Tax=Bacillus salacetis TaxID=2315464 RepID=UPI0014441658|nr:ABC transporter ATP-binding protein [Bacillus salacetis]
MNHSVLEVKGLEKKYKKFKFGPVHLRLEKGTAVALLGGNGSGKSTLFRLLMNILQPEAGTVTLFGADMGDHGTEAKRRIGFVGDMLEPFSSQRIKDIASLVSHWYPTWDQARYSHFIKRYGIDENEKYGKCSKGTKKKVEFVLSLCHSPDILLLDEPSANLDIVSQRKVKEDLVNFLEDGEKSILLATHIMDDVRQICDYIYILEDGQVNQFFEKDEIHEKWAAIWVNELPEHLKDHPNVFRVNHLSGSTVQVVTNDLSKLEEDLLGNHVSVEQVSRLTLEEIIEYMIEG